MSKQHKNQKASKARRGLFILASACVLTIAVLVAALLITAGDNSASAKSAGHSHKPPLKSLQIVSVDTPTSFQGLNPFPTTALPNQYLLAITINYARDHKDHIRSSEDGEVYLSDANGNTYHTVDTQVPQVEGPGHKPNPLVTFVFSVPQSVQPTTLTFHYSSLYSVSLPRPKQNGKGK